MSKLDDILTDDFIGSAPQWQVSALLWLRWRQLSTELPEATEVQGHV